MHVANEENLGALARGLIWGGASFEDTLKQLGTEVENPDGYKLRLVGSGTIIDLQEQVRDASAHSVSRFSSSNTHCA